MICHIYSFAYFSVHSFAVTSKAALSSRYCLFTSCSKGWSVLGTTNNVWMALNTSISLVSGLQASLSRSKHILPVSFLTFGWYTFVLNSTFGGLKG